MTAMTRRAFLAAAALAAAGGAGILYRRADDGFDPELEQTRDAARVLDELEPARRVGRAYLDDHPGEAAEATLVRLLEREPGWSAAWDDADALAQLARRTIRSEYADGTTVTVQGWLLSRTEARLCALVTFG